jgi:Flp pilus assembly protein TadG
VIRRRLTARLARERGQSMVEFAIVANLALLLLFAIFQGGVSWYHRMALEEASREAARTAIVSVSLGSTGMQSAARTEALKYATDKSGLSPTILTKPGNIVVTSSIPGRSTTCTQAWQADCDVTVEIKNYPWSIGLMGIHVLSGSFDVKTSMRIEGG